MAEDLILRPYQVDLLEIAYQRNTIIHLPTGSGKTCIATSLIERFNDGFKKPWGEGGKRTFFLVNTVPLVEQHRNTIERKVTKLVVGYSGENGVDYWNKEKWTSELKKYHVIVLTSAILADMLTHGYVTLQDINLLIFDECHHAIIDHPMRLVMKHFESCPVELQPRVLGLTAPLLNSNVKISNIGDKLKDLETTFHATIATADSLEKVQEFSANPEEEIVFFLNPQTTSEADGAISVLLNLIEIVNSFKLPDFKEIQDKGEGEEAFNPKRTLQDVSNIVQSCQEFIYDYGLFGGSIGILAFLIILQRLKFAARSIEEELLYTTVFTHLSMARMMLEDIMSDERGFRRIVKYSSPQILEFLSILKRYSDDNDKGRKDKKKLSCIVFVEKRLTSKILFNILKEVKKSNPAQFGFINHEYIVGMQVNPFKNTREDYYRRKKCEDALLKFRNKELNLLIATSVIEEGVDIPQCDLVLKFDAPRHYRSYIQSKGRARCRTSKFIIMVGESEREKFQAKYRGLKETEKFLEELLWGDAKRNEPSKNEIHANLYHEDTIPPFVSKEGLTLRAISAMSLINRYCSLLARDQYTVITPNLTQKKVGVRIRGCPVKYTQVFIYMPLGCPIKEPIKGEPMPNLKDAKCSAALKTCIKLYEIGELGPDLLPTKPWNADFGTLGLKSNFEEVWKADDELKDPKPGTKKRIRSHDIIFPPCLDENNNGYYYLHIIHTTPSFDCPSNSKQSQLYKLLLHNQSFGLITANKLPKLCDFPMFLPIGEVKISVEVNSMRFCFDERELDVVKRFHYYLFDQVLGIANKLLCYGDRENSIFVVAIDKFLDEFVIDFQLMADFEDEDIAPVATPSDQERKNLRFKADDYELHVVTPWYREEIKNLKHPERYIVTEVLRTNPFSPIPSMCVTTYDKYCAQKYGLQVLCKKQCMLEVVDITSRLNCLLPRSKPKQTFDEHFVPEFCIKYNFPASLWFKATMIPSILHRIFMLLVANDLRTEILKGLNCESLHPASGNWKPIIVDKHATAKPQAESNQKILNKNNKLNKFKSLKEQLFELDKKELKKKYPWDESSEPLDIERNICEVTLEDIEKYNKFISMPVNSSGEFGLKINFKRTIPLTTKTTLNQKYSNKINLYNYNKDKYPELRDILTAITTIKSNDCFNNERYETLGDAYLKFKVTLDLLTMLPDCKEGELTSMKGKIIGNRNLYYAGCKLRLPGRIKISQFSPREVFLIPGFFLHKKLRNMEWERSTEVLNFKTNLTKEGILSGRSDCIWELEDGTKSGITGTSGTSRYHPSYEKIQLVSDKTVADCVEALIGLFLDKGGLSVASDLLKWLQIMPKPTNIIQKDPVFKNIPVPDEDIDRLLNHNTRHIERILGYTFKNKALLLEALSHPSYIRNRVTRSYERLEFLGDAILDFLITKYIYDNCGDLSPGELTDLRSALVNNVTFASYVVKLDLYRYICYQINPALEKAILTFVDHQVKRNHQIEEQVIYLIDEEECRTAQYVEVPKVLSDVFESLIGAIYTDCEDLNLVWSVVFNIMQTEIDEFSRNIPIQPVRVLLETTDARPSFGPSSTPESNEPIVMVPVTFTKNCKVMTVFGFGSNRFGAKRAAAKLALKVLNT